MFDLVFYEPCIPGNTGSAIRLSAVTGCQLHLVEPLGFDMEEAKLKRAGLDYHDLAHVTIHPNWNALLEALPDRRIFAFTTHTENSFAQVEYEPGDVLLFGPEPDGLPEKILTDPHIHAQVRIPMIPGRRSLNLANSAAIAVYEAWRQHGFRGGE